MWMNRQRYEDLTSELRGSAALLAAKEAELERERTKVLLLERALASSQANVDWLRVMANQLSLDRAAIAATKGLTLPTPAFSGRLQTPADVAARAAAIAREEGGGAPADPVPPAVQALGTAIAEDDVDGALRAFGSMTGGFEDVGDEQAEALGISHDNQGELEYSK